MKPQLRALTVEGYERPSRIASGKPPKLEWLPLAALRVDDAYQRDINATGRKNILRIAENFNWAAFSTVIVAPAGEKGLYSIVDGQHRCTAAMLIGLDRVPCQIVDIAAADQARAFEQVNANQTRVRTEQRFYALVAAGDPAACAIMALAKEGGVEICRYPISAKNMKPRQTMMTWQLGGMAETYGRRFVVLALRAIGTTAKPDAVYPENTGLLNFALIGGAASAFRARGHWDDASLIEGFGSFDLARVDYSTGLGQGGRVKVASESIGRRLDMWATRNNRRFEKTHAPQAAPAAIMKHKGVSLARVPSLERGEA